MLKAVRFDPDIHDHLLTYIDNYRDSKGKPNYSEAIRVLMEKGYESIHSNQVIEQKIETPFDINSIKNQVYSDIMEELTKKFFSQMNNQTPVQPVYKEPIEFTKKEVASPPLKPISKPVDTTSIAGGSGLLANLIGNANR